MNEAARAMEEAIHRSNNGTKIAFFVVVVATAIIAAAII